MSQSDPIEVLGKFYATKPNQPADDQLLARVYKARAGKAAKLGGALAGLVLGSCLALGVLVWASTPSKTSSTNTAAAIARYQMMSSGLADNGPLRARVR